MRVGRRPGINKTAKTIKISYRKTLFSSVWIPTISIPSKKFPNFLLELDPCQPTLIVIGARHTMYLGTLAKSASPAHLITTPGAQGVWIWPRNLPSCCSRDLRTNWPVDFCSQVKPNLRRANAHFTRVILDEEEESPFRTRHKNAETGQRREDQRSCMAYLHVDATDSSIWSALLAW